MAIQFENYNNFVPVRIAAQQSGYTADYITRLAREGKIFAEKNGKQWLVDLEALQQFIFEVSRRRSEHQARLRSERKLENIAYRTHREASIQDSMSAGRMPALMQTCMVLAFVLSATAMQFYAVPSLQIANQLANTSYIGTSAASLVESVAVSLYELIHPETRRFSSVPSHGLLPQQSDRRTSGEQHTNAYTFTVLSEEEAALAVEEGFSDEVQVTFDIETPGAGVIVPYFKSRDDSVYRFQIFLEQTSVVADGNSE